MAALHRPAIAASPLAGKAAKLRPGKFVVVVAVIALVGAAVFQVNQFSRLTSTSYAINALNAQRASRQAENYQLEADVARLSSLARVDWEARTRLRLEPAQSRLYIDVNRPLPDKESLPTRFLPAGRLPNAQPSDPFWKWLLRALPFF
jgi:cell division protein FtsL